MKRSDIQGLSTTGKPLGVRSSSQNQGVSSVAQSRDGSPTQCFGLGWKVCASLDAYLQRMNETGMVPRPVPSPAPGPHSPLYSPQQAPPGAYPESPKVHPVDRSAGIPLRRLCVFCGSATGNRPIYTEQALHLGGVLARAGIGLVYGGASVGVMGAVADGALEAGGEVIGVIPRSLARKEIFHENLTELHVVETMHERKAMMAELSDGFIALPGGFGTFDELCEILTWAQLGIHRKPVGLLNVLNYFDGLLSFFDHTLAEGFIRPTHRAMICVDDTAENLVHKLRHQEPLEGPKWLNASET